MLENLKKLIKSKNKKENYNRNYDSKEDVQCNDDIFIIIIIIFYIIILITAIVFLVRNFNFLPDVAKALSLISLFSPCMGGPIGTIIIVFYTRKFTTSLET